MTVNTSKTKFMSINPHSNCPVNTTRLYIDETPLMQVHVYEYLGVHIDDKLTMKNHIENVCKSVQRKYGILRKIRRYISCKTALLVYKVMIRPHFDYGDYLIDSGTQCNIDKLEKIQNRILRTVEYENRVGKREDMVKLKSAYNIEDLATRGKRNLLKLMFKHSLDKENIDYHRPDRVLRSNDKVKLKSRFTRITKIQRSPYYRGVQLWNMLPTELQNEKNAKRFKGNIDKYKIVK